MAEKFGPNQVLENVLDFDQNYMPNMPKSKLANKFWLEVTLYNHYYVLSVALNGQKGPN